MLWPAVKLVSVLLWKLFLSCIFSKRPGAKIAKNEACHRRQKWNQNPGAVFVPPLQTASILSPPGGPAFGTPVLEFSPLARANFPALCSTFIRLFPPCVFFGNASARVCRCMIYALAVAWSPRMRLFLLNSAPCPAAMPACTFATATLNKGASAQAHELSLEPHDMDAYSLFTMGAMQLSDGRTKFTLIVAVMIWAACALARLHTHTHTVCIYITCTGTIRCTNYIWSVYDCILTRLFLLATHIQEQVKLQCAEVVSPTLDHGDWNRRYATHGGSFLNGSRYLMVHIFFMLNI